MAILSRMIVHQIWIGTKPPPQIWMDSVKEFCAEYKHKYMLWDNAEVQTLNLRSYPGIYELYEYYLNSNNQHKWAACADILRYVILYERGGCYLDSDSVVVNGSRLDKFLRDFRTGIVAGYEKKDSDLIAIGVILCNQYNRMMKEVLDKLPDFVAERPDKMVWEQTGPVFFTEMVRQHKKQFHNDCTIVPYHYFYPIHWIGIENPDEHKNYTFPPDTMLFQYGYSTNNFDKKLKQKQEPKSTHMYTVLLALGALYLVHHFTS